MIDDRTANLNLPKPNALNFLADDVSRLRTALDGIDTAVTGKQADLGYIPENVANKGIVNGYAGLDGGGKVPSSQLPSYVDDVVEVANYAALPVTGETGKIYVLLTPYTSGGVTSAQFRWTGSAYAPIVSSPGSTDAVPEGTTNLYFTSARALAAVPVASASVAGKVKVGSGINVAGDGTISIDGAGQTFEDVLLTATSNGQTAFTTTYTVGAIDVYLNGVKLNGGGDDFTATSGTSITLTVGINTTDTLVMRRWSTFLVANAATLGGVETLSNKSLALGSNTISGTTAQFNAALTDGDFATLAGAETLSNKTLTNPTLNNASASGLTLNDGYTEEVFAVTGTTPALSPTNGSIQTWTLTANSTPTAGTWESGQSMTLMVDDGTAFTVNWTSIPVTWKTNGGSAPTLVESGPTPIVLWKVGAAIYGARVGDN